MAHQCITFRFPHITQLDDGPSFTYSLLLVFGVNRRCVRERNVSH